MWKLFLDDIRDPIKVNPTYIDCELARSYDDAVKMIEDKGCPSFIAFDHDLAFDHYSPLDPKYQKPSMCGTGYDLAHWLVYKDIEKRGKFIPDDFKFAIHSANPVGAKNIRELLTSYLVFKQEEQNRKGV